MSDASDLIVAGCALLGVMGTAIGFIWRKIEKRIAVTEAKVDECETHREADKKLIGRLTFEVVRDARAVRMLFDDLHKRDPKSATLRNVGAILRERWDPGLSVPDAWNDLLAMIDDVDERRAEQREKTA